MSGPLNDFPDRAGVRQAIRSHDLTSFEFRDDSAEVLTFEGVASVVDTPYTVRDSLGEFTETIRAGAFNRTLRNAKADVALFINHDTRALPLATRAAGNLRLSADPNLRVVADLNPLRPSVQEARHAVADGQARQMSIGFRVPNDPAKDQWNADYTERVIHEINLHETSIVWQGASPTTSGGMRSFDELMESLVDLTLAEDDLRRAITALQLRLPADTPVEVTADLFAERDRADRERLERKIADRPPLAG